MQARHALWMAAVWATLLAACRPPLRVPPNEIPPPTSTPDPAVTWRVAAPADVIAAIKAAVDAENGGALCDGKARLSVSAIAMPLDSDPPAAQRAVRDAALEAARDDRTWLLITTADSAAVRILLPELGVAHDDPIPVVGLGATAPGLTGPGNASEPDLYYPIGRPNFLRLTADDGARAEALAAYAASAGLRAVAVVGDARRPDVMDTIATRLKPLTVALQAAYAPTATATAILKASPDLVYFAGERGSEAGALAAALRAAGYPGRFAGGPALLAPGFIEAAGPAAEGALTADAAASPVARAGDAAVAALSAVKGVCATPSRDAFRRALVTPRDLAVASGKLSIAASGDVQPMPVAVLRRVGNGWMAP